MKIRIPDKIFGQPIAGGIERRFAQNNNPTNPVIVPVNNPNNVNPIINPKVNLSDYVQLGMNGLHGKPVIISKFETLGTNNKNYEDTHRFVLQNGLYVPTPLIFMNFFSSILNVYNNRINLFDGNGNIIQRKEIEDMYLHLTKNHISTYNIKGKEGAWTWLNAKFVPGSGFNNLDLETVVGINNSQLLTKKESLKQCLNEDAWVNIDFNSQGLMKVKSSDQEYKQGNNILFWKPVENRVAGFVADSDWAILYCYGNPLITYGALGVYTCAEGA